jgi:hypothetical protein
MRKLFTLMLLAPIAIGCSLKYAGTPRSSKDKSMTSNVETQAELDAGNQRIREFKQELLQQGFHEVSVAHSDSASDSQTEFTLDGKYGTLRNVRVTLQTRTQLQVQKDQPELRGGVKAGIWDEQADRDFEELYKKVVFVVTGRDL